PHHVKRNKENRDNTQSKSDKKDALVIADMVKNGYYSFIHLTSEDFEKLRVLMSNRDFIVKRLVSSINQINRWVDIVFPELRQVFKDVKGKGAIATLRLFPTPVDLRLIEAEDIVKGWRTLMKRQPGLKKAQKLIQLAKNSVGTTQALDAYKLQLEQLLEEFDLATIQLEKVEEEATDALKNITFTNKILGIKGITENTLAGILGETGDLSKFAHANSLQRPGRISEAEARSGTWKGPVVNYNRGSSHLSRNLNLSTMSQGVNNTKVKYLHALLSNQIKMIKMKSM